MGKAKKRKHNAYLAKKYLQMIDLKNQYPDGKIPILIMPQGEYFYICRPVTKKDRELEPHRKKFITVSNTNFSTMDKAEKEFRRLINTKDYTFYVPDVEDIAEAMPNHSQKIGTAEVKKKRGRPKKDPASAKATAGKQDNKDAKDNQKQ